MPRVRVLPKSTRSKAYLGCLLHEFWADQRRGWRFPIPIWKAGSSQCEYVPLDDLAADDATFIEYSTGIATC